MNDWKKAVVGSTLAFCFISVFVGIFSLVSVVQMTHYDLMSNGVRMIARDPFRKDVQILSYVSLAVLVVCAACFVFCFLHLFWKEKTREKMKKIAMISLLVIAVFSLVLVVVTFLIPTRLEPYNTYYSNYKSYYDFAYYQSCLSGVLSGFLPMLFGAGTLLCYRFFTDRVAKGNKIVEKPETTESDRVEE